MRTTSYTLIVAAIFLGGCAQQPNGPTAKSTDTTDTAAKASSEFPDKDPPIEAETHYAAGQLAEVQHSPEKAMAQYRKTLALKPNHDGATFRLAVLYTEMRQYDQAIPLWQKYVGITHGSSESVSNLAHCYELAGKQKEAEMNYQAAITHDPKCEPAHINYGVLLAKMGRLEEARQQLSSVVSAPAVHYYVGFGRERAGDKVGAVKEYRTALSLDPYLREAQARIEQLTGTDSR